jgi:hypothetical protein
MPRSARDSASIGSVQNACCDKMRAQLDLVCPDHADLANCPDSLIVRASWGYGLRVHDGGGSAIQIGFCPWCGASLDEDC